MALKKISEVLDNPENLKNTPTRTPIEDELAVDARELLRRDMNITSFDNTFENFVQLPGTEKAVAAMQRFAETCRPPLILLYGGVGSGKTHLLEAVAIYWRKQGKFARVIAFSTLLSGLKRAMKPRAVPDNETLLERYCRAGSLLLDDYGMGAKDTEWSQSILEVIIDYRYHESLPTVVATNRDITEMPERVYSRFSDKKRGLIVLDKGKDFRQR